MRPRRLAVGGACVAFAGGAAFLAVVGSARFDGRAAVTFGEGTQVVTLARFESGSHILGYRHGEMATMSFPVTNRGAVPLRVTRVDLGDESMPLLETVSVHVGGDDLPATIGPGDAAVVRLTVRYGNCHAYHERELQSFRSATIAGSVLGVTVTRRVAFDHPLVVRSPMIVDCPDRTLARDDHHREQADRRSDAG